MERVERMLLSLHRGMTISVHYQRLLLSWNGRTRLLAGAGLGHFPGYVNGQTAFGTVLFPLGLRCPYGFRAHHFEAGLSFTATATTNDAGRDRHFLLDSFITPSLGVPIRRLRGRRLVVRGCVFATHLARHDARPV